MVGNISTIFKNRNEEHCYRMQSNLFEFEDMLDNVKDFKAEGLNEDSQGGPKPIKSRTEIQVPVA